jgi:hypothetical protein
MLFHIGSVDEHIVKVTHGEVVNIRSYTIVNVSLKCHLCICEPQRHNYVFELKKVGSECCLELVAFLHSNELIGILDVQYR